jgi:N-methylhydantoinase A
VRYAERDTRNPSPDRERPVHFGAVGWLDTKVVDRLGLAAGDEVEGPCVVEELDSTLVLAPGMRGRVDEVGNIVITLERNTG